MNLIHLRRRGVAFLSIVFWVAPAGYAQEGEASGWLKLAAKIESAPGATPFEIRRSLDRLVVGAGLEAEGFADPIAPKEARGNPPSDADAPKPHGDLPVLGFLFNRRPPPLSRYEAWLLDYLPKAIGPELKVRFEDVSRRVYDAKGEETTKERTVVLSGPEALRSKSEEVLAALASRRDFQILTELVFIGRERSGDVPFEDATTIEMLDAGAFEELRASVKASKASLLSAPSVLTTNGVRAMIQVGSQINYVKDYKLLTTGPDSGAIIADPIIGTLFDGLTVDVFPVLVADGSRIHLRIESAITSLVRPIREFRQKVGEGEFTLQLPETHTRRFQSEVALPTPVATARIRGLRWYDQSGGERTMDGEILVRTKVVDALNEAFISDSASHSGIFESAERPDLLIFDAADRPDVLSRKSGETLDVVRDGAVVGRWKVEVVSDRFLVLRRVKGEKPTGADQLRPTPKDR